MFNPAWSEERLAKLAQLVAEGLSASQIAAQLRHGITRSAVVGMCARKGLKLGHSRGWPKSMPRPEAKHQRPSLKPVTLVPAPTKSERPPLPAITRRAPIVFRAPDPPGEPASRKLPLEEWTAFTCKWIAGEGAGGLACGHPADQGTAYCEHHLRRSLGRLARAA